MDPELLDRIEQLKERIDQLENAVAIAEVWIRNAPKGKGSDTLAILRRCKVKIPKLGDSDE